MTMLRTIVGMIAVAAFACVGMAADRYVFYDGTNFNYYSGGQQQVGNAAISGTMSIANASETNHAVPFGQLEDMLSDLAVMTLYGSTNLGTVFTGDGTLLDDRPTNSQSVAVALDVGTNFIGTFMYETPIDGSIMAQNMIGRFWYSKSAATTVGGYMELITICTNTSTTNVIGTSAILNLPSQAVTSERLTVNIRDAVECDGQFLGVRFYLVRTGNPAVTVTTYMGTPYDTHLEGAGLGGISGYVPSTRAITINGEAGALSSNVAWTVGDVRTDQSNTFAGGTTQAVDGLTASNITMRGNIALGSGWMSGDGGNEGVSVDSSGNALASGVVSAGALLRAYVNDNVAGWDFSNIGVNYFCTNSTTSSASWNIYRAGGTKSSPSVTSNGYSGFFNFRVYNGSAWRQASAVSFYSAEDATASYNGGRIIFWTVQTNQTALSQAVRIDHNRSVYLYNMTTAPVTGSGYGVIAATNNEVYVWDGSGNRTQLSSENEKGEMIRKTDKPFAGFTEIYNQTLAGQMLEELAASANPEEDALIKKRYKGRIYEKIMWDPKDIPDWRANEARQAAERAAEIAAWEQADTAHKAEVARWESIPFADKAKLQKPTKEDDRPKPEPYTARPIPSWAAEAQKRFDSKWGAVEK